LVTKFGVLILDDYSAHAAQLAEELRAASIQAWTANTEFEVHWLMQRASVNASLALVDLRHVDVGRDEEVPRLAALAAEALRPLVLVAASDNEARAFQGVLARVPAGATDTEVVAAVEASRDRL